MQYSGYKDKLHSPKWNHRTCHVAVETDIILSSKYKTHKLRKYTYICTYIVFKRSTEFKEIRDGINYLSSL